LFETYFINILKLLSSSESVGSHSPSSFDKRVGKYFNKLWMIQRGAESEEIVTFLPIQLYSEIVGRTLETDLSKLFFFSSTSAEFQRALISKLTIHHYLSGEYMFRTGQAADRLYLVFKGNISLESLDQQPPPPDERKRNSDDISGKGGTIIFPAGRRHSNTSPNIVRRGSVSELSVRTSSNSTTDGIMPSTGSNKEGTAFLGSRSTAFGKRNSVTKSSVIYQTTREGFVGESEFFFRTLYSCCALNTADSVVFEISFSAFWELLGNHSFSILL